MMWDLERYGCVVGIMYGLDDPTIVEGLEEAIDAVSGPEDRGGRPAGMTYSG
ncbi:MAG: hypothetical protein ACLFUV_07680 [Methanomassiliicoccales archaeon]